MAGAVEERAGIVPRRTILKGGVGAAALLAAGCGTSSDEPDGAAVLDDPAWPTPEVVSASSGVTSVDLAVAVGTFEYKGRQITGALYNGSLPGPVIRVEPGGVLRVVMRNELTEDYLGTSGLTQSSSVATNLHTHGLHVSPLPPGDNIYMDIDRGSSFEYEYEIPADHPPGAFWYHPHRHGTNAAQLAAGLAGALIVEDSESFRSTAPAIANLPERLIVLQPGFIGSNDKTEPFPPPVDSGETVEQAVFVNGQLLPTMTVQTDQPERWRIINAATSMSIELTVGRPLRLIGLDGTPLPFVQTVTTLQVPAGGRAEVVAELTEPGRLSLRALDMSGYWRDRTDLLEAYESDRDPDAANAQELAAIDVVGDPVTGQSQIPISITDEYFADLRMIEPDNRRVVTLDRAADGNFTMDEQVWTPDRIDHTVSLWAVEEWVFVDNDSQRFHPMHIHQNPFQVVAVNGLPVQELAWRDVATCPIDGSLTMRSYFRDFWGKYPVHCHNLNHEVSGMMQNVEVVDDGRYQPRALADLRAQGTAQ